MVTRLPLAGAAALLLSAAAPAFAAPGCAERLLPPAATGPVSPMTARALVELRDFGRSDSAVAGEPPFSVSPDGRSAVMAVRRADPDADSYCIGVLLVALDGRAPPRLLDVGGAFILLAHDVRDAPDVVNGSPDPGTPLWSPDSTKVAFLRRDAGVTQVWTVGLDGAPARQLTHGATDVTGFSWSRDGRTILARARPGLAAARAAIDQEGRRGFLFDKRFWTVSDDRPRPALPLPTVTIAVDVGTGAVRETPPVETADPSRPAGAVLVARSAGGWTAWTGSDDPSLFLPPSSLHVSGKGGPVHCPADICGDHIAGLWWIGTADLLFERAGTPDNGGRSIFYRWRLGRDGAPVRVLETIDALFGCQPVGARLLCAHETATHPRTLAWLDPATGATTTLFDPNPEFATHPLGRVRRMVWSADGITTYGDLVLPPGHRPGERHPLVIVQYTSRGFLRGGTGDEVPIQLLAARGFAVLSFQRPGSLPGTERAHSLIDYQRVAIAGWTERRLYFAALDAGIDAAVATGAIDAQRIGITGLSDGASTTQYALLHSSRFKAAALGGCCEDPGTSVAAGLSYRDFLLESGYPPPGFAEKAFWQPYSLALNADRLKTPLLIQVPDGEYRLALETYSALQLHGAPVEMYVFPDEHHVKWHPAHRLAAYERYVDWFDFWLNGRASADPARQAELRRWEALRRGAGRRLAAPAARPGLDIGEHQQPHHLAAVRYRRGARARPPRAVEPAKRRPAPREQLVANRRAMDVQGPDAQAVEGALALARDDACRQQRREGAPRHGAVAAAGAPMPARNGKARLHHRL